MPFTDTYPNPVLGNGDDVLSHWDVPVDRFNISERNDYIDISFRVECDDPDLPKLIENGDAKIIARLDCGQTLTRQYLDLHEKKTSTGWIFTASIDQQDVINKVTISVYAIAIRDLPDMFWQHQHVDYDNEHFAVAKGEYLTRPIAFDFVIDKLYDPFDPPSASCINIRVNPNMKKNIAVGYDEDQLQIFVSNEIKNWMNATGDKNMLYAMVVLPALVDAICYLRDEDRNPGDDDPYVHEWAKVFNQKLKAMNLKKDDALKAAQALLSDPIDAFAATELNSF